MANVKLKQILQAEEADGGLNPPLSLPPNEKRRQQGTWG